jgi:hypothetical protein
MENICRELEDIMTHHRAAAAALFDYRLLCSDQSIVLRNDALSGERATGALRAYETYGCKERSHTGGRYFHLSIYFYRLLLTHHLNFPKVVKFIDRERSKKPEDEC